MNVSKYGPANIQSSYDLFGFFCQKGKFPLQRGFPLSTSLVYPRNNNILGVDISRINWNVFRVLNFSFQLLLL